MVWVASDCQQKHTSSRHAFSLIYQLQTGWLWMSSDWGCLGSRGWWPHTCPCREVLSSRWFFPRSSRVDLCTNLEKSRLPYLEDLLTNPGLQQILFLQVAFKSQQRCSTPWTHFRKIAHGSQCSVSLCSCLHQGSSAGSHLSGPPTPPCSMIPQICGASSPCWWLLGLWSSEIPCWADSNKANQMHEGMSWKES